MNKNNYVYFHRNPISGDIFYVGVGTKQRAWSHRNRNNQWHNVVNKYGGFTVEIRQKNITRDMAFRFEIRYIKFFGRRGYDTNGILVNSGIGGEGTSGFKFSKESSLKLSIAMKNRSPEVIDKIAKSHVGLKRSSETRSKMSKNNVAKRMDERERRRIAMSSPLHPMRVKNKEIHPFLGKKHSNATKKKIAASKIGTIPVNRKPVLQTLNKGEVVNSHESLTSAAKSIGRNPSTLSEAIKNKTKCCGFFWEYL